jgi:hypothetical protein
MLETADLSSRSPTEPVSTSTPLTGTQDEVPGAQTVTVVKAPLTYPLARPLLVVKAAQLPVELLQELLRVDDEELLLLLLELDPPPQAATNINSEAAATSKARLDLFDVIGCHPPGHQGRNVGVSDKAPHVSGRFHDQPRRLHDNGAASLTYCLDRLGILVEVRAHQLL